MLPPVEHVIGTVAICCASGVTAIAVVLGGDALRRRKDRKRRYGHFADGAQRDRCGVSDGGQ